MLTIARWMGEVSPAFLHLTAMIPYGPSTALRSTVPSQDLVAGEAPTGAALRGL